MAKLAPLKAILYQWRWFNSSQATEYLEQTTTGPEGKFQLTIRSAGEFLVKVEAAGFRLVSSVIVVHPTDNSTIEVHMKELASRSENMTVTAHVNDVDVFSPDPAEKVFVMENMLDANPGLPGAPVSIPGYPIETASSGIKASQYLAPGVAGDHGEPIAQHGEEVHQPLFGSQL